jgi:hypothetical protein
LLTVDGQHLSGECADAARGADDEHLLAGLQLRLVTHGLQGCHRRSGHRRLLE